VTEELAEFQLLLLLLLLLLVMLLLVLLRCRHCIAVVGLLKAHVGKQWLCCHAHGRCIA